MTPPRLPAALLHLPIAHRGLHDLAKGRPENSLAAIRAAMAAGYAIEIDLQLTADGVAVVFHDDDLTRLTGASGLVCKTSAFDLQALALLSTSERPPTLAEVLAEVAGQVPLLIEFKAQAAGPGPLERAAAPLLAAYDGPFAVMSFEPPSVKALAALLPDVPRGLTTMHWQGKDAEGLSAQEIRRRNDIADYAGVGAGFISHHAADLASPAVAQLRDAGADILCWTIRSPQAATAARKIAANITFENFLP